MESMKEKLVLWFRRFFKKDFKLLLPQIYALVLLFGFILTLLYAAFPSLSICSSFFGEEFCTPAGIYIGLMASLPGYVVAGNLLSSFNELPSGLSFMAVIVTSALFYYLLGMLIDKARKKTTSKPVIVIISLFLLLLTFLVLLLVQLM